MNNETEKISEPASLKPLNPALLIAAILGLLIFSACYLFVSALGANPDWIRATCNPTGELLTYLLSLTNRVWYVVGIAYFACVYAVGRHIQRFMVRKDNDCNALWRTLDRDSVFHRTLFAAGALNIAGGWIAIVFDRVMTHASLSVIAGLIILAFLVPADVNLAKKKLEAKRDGANDRKATGPVNFLDRFALALPLVLSSFTGFMGWILPGWASRLDSWNNQVQFVIHYDAYYGTELAGDRADRYSDYAETASSTREAMGQFCRM